MFSRVAATSSKAIASASGRSVVVRIQNPTTLRQFYATLPSSSSGISPASQPTILFCSPHERKFSQKNGDESSSGINSKDKMQKSLPKKETLLRIDWIVEHMIPKILKAPIQEFYSMCSPEVEFSDSLYNYNLRGRDVLSNHIAKMRIYFHYKSPFCKVERIGSSVYENDDVIVVLWRLSTLQSGLLSYIPKFISRREPKINTVEGASDLHVNADGFIYKIVNRKITASDREGARAMEKLKAEQAEFFKQREEKTYRKGAFL
ncbi:hypothetical protein WR25_14535 [Diploscapter pachys]|uniref:Uncharacterized protein n=1 Tax=Diploscapter pachys TaxID=2018661 RepID=A0A2A2JUF7_9BILA|nr:hypothetical protein WR25_14535 [Diploscapter pachys]